MAIKNTKQKILPKTLPSPTAPRTRTWLFNFPAWRGAARGKNSVCLWAKGKKLMCARLRRWVWGSAASLWAPLCGLCLQRWLTPSWEDIGAQLGMDRPTEGLARLHLPPPSFRVKVRECIRAVGSWEGEEKKGRGREERRQKKEEERRDTKTEKEEPGDRDRHEWERDTEGPDQE